MNFGLLDHDRESLLRPTKRFLAAVPAAKAKEVLGVVLEAFDAWKCSLVDVNGMVFLDYEPGAGLLASPKPGCGCTHLLVVY